MNADNGLPVTAKRYVSPLAAHADPLAPVGICRTQPLIATAHKQNFDASNEIEAPATFIAPNQQAANRVTILRFNARMCFRVLGPANAGCSDLPTSWSPVNGLQVCNLGIIPWKSCLIRETYQKSPLPPRFLKRFSASTSANRLGAEDSHRPGHTNNRLRLGFVFLLVHTPARSSVRRFSGCRGLAGFPPSLF